MNSGEVAAAEKMASLLLRTHPRNFVVLDLRAQYRATDGRSAAAEEDWRKVVKICKGRTRRTRRLQRYEIGGSALLKLYAWRQAERFLLEALERFPGRLRFQRLLARAYAGQDKIEEALNALSPDDPVAKVASAFFSQGLEAALVAWRDVRKNLLDDRQRLAEALNDLFEIFVLFRQRDPVVAIGLEEDFVSLVNPLDYSARPVIRIFIGSLIASNKISEAKKISIISGFEGSALEADLILAAEVAFAERQYDGALSLARRTLERSPTSFRAHRLVVNCLAAKRAHAEVQTHLLELEAQGALDYTLLGTLARNSGQVDLADRFFSQSLGPGDTRALRAYTDFLQRVGRWDRIGELASEYVTCFAKDDALRRILDEIKEVSGSLDGSDSTASPPNAMIAIYDNLLRMAPARESLACRTPRVAMVIGSLGPGGAERQCAVLCQQLAQYVSDGRIADVRVFATNLTRGDRAAFCLSDIKDSGISVVEFYSRTKQLNARDHWPGEVAADLVSSLRPQSDGQRVLQLYENLADFDPDIVHAWLDSSIYAAGLASAFLPNACLVGRWGSLPPTVQRVSSPLEQNQATVLCHAYRALARLNTVQFTANARLAADAYADWIGLPRSEIHIVKNGLDFSRLERSKAAGARIRKELGIASDAVVIGTAIRLGSEKRPSMWLDIADKVAAQRSGVEFLIVGDGPLLDDIRIRAQQLAHARVRLVGRQSNISDWYNAMDVTLMTSSVEGLSNTVIESAYMGLPVVAYDVGGMSEAVINDQTGFLLPEGDINGIVEALVRLVDKRELRANMSASASQYATENFHAARMAESVLSIYDSLLERR